MGWDWISFGIGIVVGVATLGCVLLLIYLSHQCDACCQRHHS
jgi:hypothetical protein